MRRPPIACQRAVQSLQFPAPQHIWVPDDVLSLAIHGFFRITCPHQKRHGSNVPGPLEARRRAAKRRMTASAESYTREDIPTSFNLGALFGYRSKPWTSWRYEPPSPPKNAPLDTPSPSTAQFVDLQARSSSNDSNPIAYGAPCSLAQPAITQVSGQTADQDANLEAASPNLSKPQSAEHALTSDVDLERCFEDFKVRIADAKGDRKEQLKESFRLCQPSSTSCIWSYCAAVLQHTLQRRLNPAPVLGCLLEKDGQLLRIADPLHNADGCAALLDCLDIIELQPPAVAKRVRQSSTLRQIYANVAQLAVQAARSTTEAQDAILLRLIQKTGYHASRKGSKELASATELLCALATNLRESAENELLVSLLAHSSHAQEVVTSTVYSVAATPDRFASAERALSYMPRLQLLAQVPTITLHFASKSRGKSRSVSSTPLHRMNVWLRLLQRVDKSLLEAAMVSLAKNMFSYDASAMVRPEILINAMLLHQDLDVRSSPVDKKTTRFQELFADVLLQVQAQPAAYSNLLNMALPLIARYAGLSLLLRSIRTMEEQKLPLSTNIDFDALIMKELGTLPARTDDLSESQLQTRAFTLQACEKLLNVLSRMGYALPARMEEVGNLVGIRQFDHLLSRAKANSSLPIAYRNSKDLTLMERVAMVHQLAHHYSEDTTRTHREVWRSIYYLYHYLSSNSLPIGPLFTKAVVHSSIIRPLSENRFVSARRLIWVCHLVARVEGNEVAGRVENHFWTWRGDLIGRAKRIYVGVGGNKQDKAHLGTMKRLGLI